MSLSDTQERALRLLVERHPGWMMSWRDARENTLYSLAKRGLAVYRIGFGHRWEYQATRKGIDRVRT